MTLTDDELDLLRRAKTADGKRLDLADLNGDEQKTAGQLIYHGYLARDNGALVLTPAGGQELARP